MGSPGWALSRGPVIGKKRPLSGRKREKSRIGTALLDANRTSKVRKKKGLSWGSLGWIFLRGEDLWVNKQTGGSSAWGAVYLRGEKH